MEKKIFITNGMARSGKDTFAEMLNKFVWVRKYSSIDKVKSIAVHCGWDGGKTERDRKFLSDLKDLTTEYSDLAFKSIEQAVEIFMGDNFHEVMLIDIREPEEIARAKEAFNAETILIYNKNVPIISSNDADANVFNYVYDHVVYNNGTLDEFYEEVKKFAVDILGVKEVRTHV